MIGYYTVPPGACLLFSGDQGLLLKPDPPLFQPHIQVSHAVCMMADDSISIARSDDAFTLLVAMPRGDIPVSCLY
jgi:hypothetical protein